MGRGKSTEPGRILEEHSGNGNSISGMPRQCPTQHDQRSARPAWPGVARRGALACAFAALMAAGPALAGSAAAAVTSRGGTAATSGTLSSGTLASGTLSSGRGAAVSSRAANSRTAAAAQHVTIGISSVSPQVARPGRAVTVQGTVSNPTRTAVSGLTVQLWSSSFKLTSRSALTEYAAGNLPGADRPVIGALAQLPGTLAPGAVRQWSIRIPASSLALTSFGVYPLAAVADSGGIALTTDRTFLPFWPGSAAAAGLSQRMKIAWIWPIFSAPEQAACQSLLNNGLASSLAGGRLSRLLTAGTTPDAVRAKLTWAIDPSVLAGAGVMRSSYRVSATPGCSGAITKRASPAARTWLSGLRSVTAQQDYFVTPYADVDMSALTHAAMNTDLQRAQEKGTDVARQYLGGTQRPVSPAVGTIAWPADGFADYGVLGNLAADGWHSVVLNDTLMPPRTAAGYTPSAITRALDGVDGGLNVALSDSGLSQVLAGAPTPAQARPASSQSAGSQSASTAQASTAAGSFATEQRFLAETAMIVAEAPATPRSVVITPPRQWNPSPALAAALLAESDNAPWLRPASLADLITAKSSAGQVPRMPPPSEKFAPGELRRSLLRKVKGLEGTIRQQASMFRQPASSYLAGAVAAVESSAWRDNPAQAKALLASVSGYLATQERQVRIIDTGQDTLTGKSGPVPLSINNRLDQSVTVLLRVHAPSDRMTVHPAVTTVTIGPHQQRIVVIKVRSAVAGSTVLRLSLAAPNGAPLPGTDAQLSVDSTHFGTTAMVIVAIAIAVFVVTAIARAVRRGGGIRGAFLPSHQSPDPGQDANGAEPSGSPGETDTVVSEPARDHDTPEEPDEYASAPGRVDRP
ncbi:MAG: hypothetical protein JWL68_3624 [Actinomycetia bacterium]|nr:hypothetical protein [Actinomycetes bacterium]